MCVVLFEFRLSCAYRNTGFHFVIIIFILFPYFTPQTLHPRNNTGTAIMIYEFRCICQTFLPTHVFL
jgi:hypothetical protein